MSNSKISALTSATTPLAGTEVLPIVQSGTTVKVATDDLTVRNIRSNATTGILQITGPAAASTRVATVPNANWTAARTDAAQSFTGDQTLSTGNLVQGTAAKGFNFTANTPLAGMTSQLLNWYEEGTYTPTINSGFTSTGSVTVSGTYTRVGRAVTIRVVINSTGTVYIAAGGIGIVDGALPYAQATGGRVSGTFNSTYSVLQGGLVQFASTTAYLIPGVTAAMNSTNTQITFVCTYQV
jgi:hypothetical protein